jgi:hypothetical protein
MNHKTVNFIENAVLLPVDIPKVQQDNAAALAELDLNNLPDAVVTGNTLVDLSKSTPEMRGPLSLALTFATLAANGAVGLNAAKGEWFASYKYNLLQLGLNVSPSSFTSATFSKKGLAVHKAIIPFLTVALGGIGVGPVIIALLENMKQEDENQPWIRLFDMQSKRYETREISLGAVSNDAQETHVRHVTARLRIDENVTNILFFKIDNSSAEFQSATTQITANNEHLSALEEPLRSRLDKLANDNIKAATLVSIGPG